MRTLSEIRRNIVSFYSAIQDRITDFSIGSVIGSIFYAFSSSLERVYLELEEIRKQAYVATATGEYLDKLIEGTFQLKRSASTRATGYVVVYGNSPLTNPESVELRYADYDYESGEFTGGVQSSTKFVGFNLQGEEGTVFSLIAPRNTDVLLPFVDPGATERLIYINRPVQFLLLPVASVSKGSRSNIREGGIYSFPSPPPGLSGVLNTRNPGLIFFSSQQAVSGAPFYSRFTQILGYSNETSSLSVLNAFNFSKTGFLEVTGDANRENAIVATYTDGISISRTAGLIFEYIDASTSNITLSLPIENSLNKLPSITVLDGNEVKELTLSSFSYKSTVYPAPTTEILRDFIEANISDGLRIQQRPDQISSDLIFDPDNVLTSDYRIIDSALVGGASDEDTDAQYRESLRKYLGSLARATNTSLEAGTLQIPGVTFAKTLPSTLTPRGSAVVLASDENGVLSGGLRGTIRRFLENDWKAAGINLIIREPELIRLNTTLTMRVEPGTSRNAVYQQASATVEEYLRQVVPGDSLRYSSLLTALGEIGGVLNVFNMILSQYLTDETYREYKAKYDEEVLVRASSSGLVEVNQVGHTFTPYSPGGSAVLIKRDIDDILYIPATGMGDATGILYNYIDDENFEVLEGNAEVLYNLYEALIERYEDAITVDYFSTVLISYIQRFGETVNDQLYFLSYILGEPIETLPSENYPLKPDFINYSVIRDYESSPVEIFRPSTINLSTRPTILVGIKFI
jgi:uncharacterized phage protein gp47/JayE